MPPGTDVQINCFQVILLCACQYVPHALISIHHLMAKLLPRRPCSASCFASKPERGDHLARAASAAKWPNHCAPWDRKGVPRGPCVVMLLHLRRRALKLTGDKIDITQQILQACEFVPIDSVLPSDVQAISRKLDVQAIDLQSSCRPWQASSSFRRLDSPPASPVHAGAERQKISQVAL